MREGRRVARWYNRCSVREGKGKLGTRAALDVGGLILLIQPGRTPLATGSEFPVRCIDTGPFEGGIGDSGIWLRIRPRSNRNQYEDSN